MLAILSENCHPLYVTGHWIILTHSTSFRFLLSWFDDNDIAMHADILRNPEWSRSVFTQMFCTPISFRTGGNTPRPQLLTLQNSNEQETPSVTDKQTRQTEFIARAQKKFVPFLAMTTTASHRVAVQKKGEENITNEPDRKTRISLLHPKIIFIQGSWKALVRKHSRRGG